MIAQLHLIEPRRMGNTHLLRANVDSFGVVTIGKQERQ